MSCSEYILREVPKFIAEHPLPSPQQLRQTNRGPNGADNAGDAMEWMTMTGDSTYMLLKQIYGSGALDSDIIKRVGHQLDSIGGLRAMQAFFYVR